MELDVRGARIARTLGYCSRVATRWRLFVAAAAVIIGILSTQPGGALATAGEPVDLLPGGTVAGAYSSPGWVSPSGRYVAFYSYADMVGDGVAGGSFLRDRLLGSTVRLTPPNEYVAGLTPSLRHVLLWTYRSLDPADTNGDGEDVYVLDRITGSYDFISRPDPSAVGATGDSDVSVDGSNAISDDGRYVAFGSTANNLVRGDVTNTGRSEVDVFLRDRVAGTTAGLTVAGSGGGYLPVMSGDGSTIVFPTTSTLYGSTDGSRFIVAVNRATLAGDVISHPAASEPPPNCDNYVAVSSTGRYAAFSCRGQLTPDAPADGGWHPYRIDRQTRALTRLDASLAIAPPPSFAQWHLGSLSADGSRVVFAGPPTSWSTIYGWDATSGATTAIASVQPTFGGEPLVFPFISGDGSVVVATDARTAPWHATLWTLPLPDTTPPTIAAQASPPPNTYGWNNTPVTVSFSCADDVALATCTPATALPGEGQGQVVSGVATDQAGNSATATANVSIDLTGPIIACPATPTYAVGQSTELIASVVDALSGATSTSATATPNTVVAGNFNVPVSATDLASNTSTISCPYVVQSGFTVTDLFSAGSIAPPPTVNTAKAGQTVPVQWRLTDVADAPISDPSSFVSVTSGLTQCGLANPLDAADVVSSASGLQYIGNGVWQYNWKTAKSFTGTCRVMRLNLANGQTGGFAVFQFK